MTKMFNRRSGLALIMAAGLLGACSEPKTDTSDASAKTKVQTEIYLVRHAEKTLGPTADKRDPALTPEGEMRSTAYAEYFKEIDLTQVYSTDYIRTRDTAQPTATSQGLSVTLYDPRDLEGFAKTLRGQTGRILVVGHSNTTPDLVNYLGGDGGPEIVEATEYDRLYKVVISDQGTVSNWKNLDAR